MVVSLEAGMDAADSDERIVPIVTHALNVAMARLKSERARGNLLADMLGRERAEKANLQRMLNAAVAQAGG
jgi:hypothetical protein